MPDLRVVTLVSALLSLPSWADPSLTFDQLKLIGIGAYEVYVEPLPPAANQCGIVDQQLKNQTELALRKNGIPVNSTAPDYVYVRLSMLFDAQLRGCIFHLEIQVRGIVQRDLGQLKGQRILATIWQKGIVAEGPSRNAPQQIRESLAELLDNLRNDHLAANPPSSQNKAGNRRPSSK